MSAAESSKNDADHLQRTAFWKAIRIARLLSIGDPIELDHSVQSDTLALLLQLDAGAVYSPRHNNYIVRSNGTLTTTSIRPPWLDDSAIVTADDDAPLRRVLLNELTAALVAVDDVNRPHLARFASRVATFYDLPDIEARRRASDGMIFDLLEQGSAQVSAALATDKTAQRWAEAQLVRLLEAYIQLRLPGCYLNTALAAFMLLKNAPVRIDALLTRVPWVRGPSADVERTSTPEETKLSPPLSFDGYLAASGVTDVAAVIWLVRTAMNSQRQADVIRDNALAVGVRPQAFYGKLMQASIYYRVAQFTYQRALSLYDENVQRRFIGSMYAREAVQREALMCEEHRVVIIGSLQHAAYPRQHPDFFKPLEVGEYLAVLARQENHVMRHAVYDLELQLRVPRKMRALFLGTTQALSGRGTELLEDVTNEMYDSLNGEDVASEPDYLTPSLLLLAEILEATGNERDAAKYRQRVAELPDVNARLVTQRAREGGN